MEYRIIKKQIKFIQIIKFKPGKIRHVIYKDGVHTFIKFDKNFKRTESMLNVTVLKVPLLTFR